MSNLCNDFLKSNLSYWSSNLSYYILDSLHNWNYIMNTFILGQDVVLILLFMILLMSNNENIITVCLRELILIRSKCSNFEWCCFKCKFLSNYTSYGNRNFIVRKRRTSTFQRYQFQFHHKFG